MSFPVPKWIQSWSQIMFEIRWFVTLYNNRDSVIYLGLCSRHEC
jgi:hypothetical protein